MKRQDLKIGDYVAVRTGGITLPAWIVSFGWVENTGTASILLGRYRKATSSDKKMVTVVIDHGGTCLPQIISSKMILSSWDDHVSKRNKAASDQCHLETRWSALRSDLCAASVKLPARYAASSLTLSLDQIEKLLKKK